LGWASRSLSKTDFEASLNVLIKKYPDNVVLQNMKKRITSIAGDFRIVNHEGTKTIFELEL
jgi:hypothetical protein